MKVNGVASKLSKIKQLSNIKDIEKDLIGRFAKSFETDIKTAELDFFVVKVENQCDINNTNNYNYGLKGKLSFLLTINSLSSSS